MRGGDEETGSLFSHRSPESLVPGDHPLRVIRGVVNAALERLSAEFSTLYSRYGRASIAPEKLLRALLLQAFLWRPLGTAADGAGQLQHAITGTTAIPHFLRRLAIVYRRPRNRVD